MIHTLPHRRFRICSNMTQFHSELVELIEVFKSNGYPENFIDNCFKTILHNKHRIKEKVITMPKKPLSLVLPSFEPL